MNLLRNLLSKKTSEDVPSNVFVASCGTPVEGCVIAVDAVGLTEQHVVAWYAVDTTAAVPSSALSRSLHFAPSANEIGKQLQLKIRRHEGSGEVLAEYTTSPVLAFPSLSSLPPFVYRQSESGNGCRSEKNFTLVSWNILADCLLSPDFYASAQRECPRWCVVWEYRKRSLLRHLLAFDADVLCLQEVDKKHFESFWQSEMKGRGYEGFYGGPSDYGEAIFFRSSRFQLAAHTSAVTRINLDKLVVDSVSSRLKGEMHADFNSLLTSREALVLNLIPVKENSAKMGIWICTTHLWTSKTRGWEFIRLLQLEALLSSLHSLIEKFSENGEFPRLVVCGDFNSSPKSCVCDFIETGQMSLREGNPRAEETPVLRILAADCTVSHSFRSSNSGSSISSSGSSNSSSDDNSSDNSMNKVEEAKNDLATSSSRGFVSAYKEVLKEEPSYCRYGSEKSPCIEYVYCLQSSACSIDGCVPIEGLDTARLTPSPTFASDHQPLAVCFGLHSL